MEERKKFTNVETASIIYQFQPTLEPKRDREMQLHSLSNFADLFYYN